jgi:hypothetical protein
MYYLEDRVILATKYIYTRRISYKLFDRYLRLFKVREYIRVNTNRLELPQKYGRLYPTFYVSLLESYYIKVGITTPELIDIDDEDK